MSYPNPDCLLDFNYFGKHNFTLFNFIFMSGMREYSHFIHLQVCSFPRTI